MGTEDRHRPSGIRAVLCVDLAQASRLDPAAAAQLADDISCRNRGVSLTDAGGRARSFSVFPLASDAVRAAIEIQVALGSRVAVDVAESPHGGVGAADAVGGCDRLLDTANEGQAITSAAALDVARPAVADDVDSTDLGVHRVRGRPDRVWIWQLDARGSRTSFPPLRTLDSVAATVPVPGTTLIGREADVDALSRLLDAHQVVTIVGAGGCGKTRLAIEVAVENAGRFRDGVAWIDLAPLSEPSSLLGTVGAAIGLKGTVEVDADRITGSLSRSSVLLVFDNCEHLAEPAARLTATIAFSCPAVRILATSREPLALAQEQVWRIPSLRVPDHADGSDLLASEAGRLLVDRIRLVRPDFLPDPTEASALAEVCRRLDGIPLALELAAARTATMSPVELASRLDDRFRLLVGGARDTIARQRTLEASVAWSHQLLTDHEQRCFRRLSAFPGSFSLDAAVRLCAGAVVDPEATIVRLAACSLLAVRPGPDTRLQMLEAVRWFARERLIDSGEAEDVLGRLVVWAVDTARELGPQLEGPRVTETLERLDADIDSIRAAMDWAVDHGRAVEAVEILASTSWYWVWRGRIIEMEKWLQRSGVDEADLQPHARLELLWATSELIGNRAGEIEDLIDQGIALAREVGDRTAEAKFRVSHSRFLAFSDPHRTIQQASEERELCRRAGTPFWSATSLVSEALANFSLGHFDRAEPLLDQLRLEARALRHPQLIADEIARRTIVDRRFGRYDAVRRAVAEIDTVTAGFTTLNSQALVHAQAALVHVAQGHAQAALAEMDGLYRRYLVAGEYGYLPSIALPIIDALIDLGRPREAVERFERMWRGFSQTISWRLRLGSARAIALLAAGDVVGARSGFSAVVDEARAAPNEHEAAIAERFLASIDRADQRFGDAEARLYRALDIQARYGYPQYVADILEELAGIELEHDRTNSAAVLLGAAAAIRNQSGVTRRIGRQAAYDADIAELQQRLGDELDQPWERGAALSMGEAVDFARRGRGERGRPTTGWESLTVTETKVAALVAEGQTNPEIAERLLMGRATVKTHVSSILRKLGLTNRTQLAGLAARRDP